ncbi:hypothetical protein ACOACO_09360 [Nocardioides sp. CPCC 205120]|uniref:hypothetical protein n=1 Tax=Nocardioides sp. CPCC 205120 TaxID=3406462 RepID=UPI003B508888
MTRPRRLGPGLTGLALVCALGLTACTDDGADEQDRDDAAPGRAPAPVALEVAGLDGPVRVGVLVSTGGASGEGSDLASPAHGAVVAERRLGAGGADVELVVADDRGDADAARRAVADLAEAGVVGVVAATSGAHLAPALADAAELDVPVLLPYVEDVAGLPAGAWSTAPSAGAVDAGVDAALRSAGSTSPVVVVGAGARTPTVAGARTVALGPAGTGAAVDAVEEAVAAGADAVVVAAPAAAQGEVVAGVQAVDDLPVVLTPQALRPAFTTALTGAGGAANGDLRTVGPDAADTTTLAADEAGDRAAAYFAALRQAADDPGQQDLLGTGPFAARAGDADLASHDAVVALVRAAEEAGSTAAGDVAAALDGLALDGASGLAGPSLVFDDAEALPDDEVHVLVGTTQDPGVRPAPAEPVVRLAWFAVPRDG